MGPSSLVVLAAAVCGAWLLLGVIHAIRGGTQFQEMRGDPPTTPQVTRVRKIRDAVAFYAKATGQFAAQTLVGPPVMARRWLEIQRLRQERSSPGSTSPPGVDTIDSLGGFQTQAYGPIGLENAIAARGTPIDAHEMTATCGSHDETIPQGFALSGIGSFHDEVSPVQRQ